MSICSQNPLDTDEFRRQGHMIIDFLDDYHKNVESYPVRSQVEHGYLRKQLPESALNNSESIETVLQDVTINIIPGLAHWQSPNYFNYFPSSGSIVGFLGEMLSQMLTLPKSFIFSSDGSSGEGGVLQGTTCAAILSAQIVGINPMHFRAIATSKATNFGLSPNSLHSTILTDIESGLVPLFLWATVGTTSSTTVDHIGPLCEVAKMYGTWVHV
ncbi:hypothetical protein MKW92_014599 [Papaver armeniacum]|nr:hypothetical protein MKW92_014599 [Papaver armeniacum]